MATLPSSTSRKFNPADYKDAPVYFTGRFLSQLNLFTDPVYQALLNGLTFQTNFNAQYFVASVQGAASYANNALSFTSTIQGVPNEVTIVQKNLASDLTVPLINPVDFSWYFASPIVYITGISGLTPGVNYRIVFKVAQ